MSLGRNARRWRPTTIPLLHYHPEQYRDQRFVQAEQTGPDIAFLGRLPHSAGVLISRPEQALLSNGSRISLSLMALRIRLSA